MSFAYMFIFFPIYARFGGGKGGAKIMFSKLFRPAAVSFGTCSSVATIPTNMEVAEETGISKDVTDIVLPMGATMHMDGSAMSAIIKVAFLFSVFGMDFSTDKAILAIIVAVFSSVAMSGIPGGGGTGELVVCTIFFPDQLAIAYPIALAIGNLVDPLPPWSMPPATMWCPSSCPAMWTARIGCRRSCTANRTAKPCDPLLTVLWERALFKESAFSHSVERQYSCEIPCKS